MIDSENRNSRLREDVTQKMADMNNEIARQDAEAARLREEHKQKQREEENKYGPRGHFFKVNFSQTDQEISSTEKPVGQSQAASKKQSSPPVRKDSAVRSQKDGVSFTLGTPAPSNSNKSSNSSPSAASSEKTIAQASASSAVVAESRLAQGTKTPAPKSSVADTLSTYQPQADSQLDRKSSDQKSSDQEAEGTQEEEKRVIKEGDQTPPSHTSALFWNICLGLGIAIIIVLGALVYQQSRLMPEDTLKVALRENEQIKKQWLEKKLAFLELEKEKIRNQAYLDKKEQLSIIKGNIELKNKKIEDLEREILGIRGEMRSYFKRYKEYTRKQARNLHFDTIQTVKTNKTYLDATIQRVTDNYVSIVHAGGAVRLDPQDLSEALQNRLGFGDPLGLNLMEVEAQQEKQEKLALNKYLPDVVNDDQKDIQPPAPQNKQQSAPDENMVPSSQIEPASKLPKVDTTQEEVNQGEG